jgi:hypothetical protein
MRRCPNVGMRNDNSFGSRSDRNDPDSFDPECTFAGPNMGWIEQNRRPAVRSFEVGGHLEMASEPKIVVLDVAGGSRQIRAAGLYATLSDYWAHTKPEVNFLILITTFADIYLASAGQNVLTHQI